MSRPNVVDYIGQNSHIPAALRSVPAFLHRVYRSDASIN
jgi:hypothetical protein